jgi:hypothetical protein
VTRRERRAAGWVQRHPVCFGFLLPIAAAALLMVGALAVGVYATWEAPDGSDSGSMTGRPLSLVLVGLFYGLPALLLSAKQEMALVGAASEAE